MESPTTRNVPREALRLSAFPVTLAAAPDGGKKRTFAGVANTGKPMKNWYWDQFVIDLADVQLNKSTAGLIDHDFSRRAAAGRLSVDSNQLLVSGTLLSNSDGQAVAQDADDGFPWQMSVYVEPGSIEQFEPGTEVQVNGQTLSGPISVFRNSKFHEFSFTPIGVDTDTEARVLSRGEGQHSTIEIPEVTHMTEQSADSSAPTVEQLKAQVAGRDQEITQLKLSAEREKKRADKAESDLTALRTSQRKKDIDALLSAKGVEVSDDAAKPYLAMSQEVFDAVQAEANALLSRGGQGEGGSGTGQSLPPQFFQPDNAGHGARLNQAENPLLADAKRRAEARST